MKISHLKYAIAVIQGENTNGKLDTNWLDIPTEGYGFSNDAKGIIGVSSFSAASFPHNGQNLNLTIHDNSVLTISIHEV